MYLIGDEQTCPNNSIQLIPSAGVAPDSAGGTPQPKDHQYHAADSDYDIWVAEVHDLRSEVSDVQGDRVSILVGRVV